jgi:hypothetical protein
MEEEDEVGETSTGKTLLGVWPISPGVISLGGTMEGKGTFWALGA